MCGIQSLNAGFRSPTVPLLMGKVFPSHVNGQVTCLTLVKFQKNHFKLRDGYIWRCLGISETHRKYLFSFPRTSVMDVKGLTLI